MGINGIQNKIILISSLFLLIFSTVITGCGEKEKKNIFADGKDDTGNLVGLNGV